MKKKLESEKRKPLLNATDYRRQVIGGVGAIEDDVQMGRPRDVQVV